MMTYQKLRGLVLDYWWIAALAVLLVGLGVWLFFGDGRNNKNERLESDIDQQKGVNAVLVNEAVNVEKEVNKQGNEVNNAANNTNSAREALNSSVNRPSNSFDGNRAGSRFCRDFPRDPSCR